MKKLLLLFASMTFIFSMALGQENYQKGYVVTLNGDTVHGSINYRDWGVNPNKIEFERASNGGKIVYRPLDIKGFFVHGELYLGAEVKSETSSQRQLNTMSDSSMVETRTDKVFLRVLANGNPGLLYYRNDLHIENFYLIKDGKIHLLEYKKYIAQNSEGGAESRDYLEENKKYVGQLMVYLHDCPKLGPQVSSAEYTRPGLIKLFQKYYACTNQQASQTAKIESTKVQFGIVAGLLTSKVMISGSNLAASKANIKSSSGFTGGIILDLIMPRNLHQWSLHNEITYSSFVATGASDVGTMKFGFSSLLLTDLARFTHSFGKISGFINAGVSNGIILNYTNYIVGNPSHVFPSNSLRKRELAWVAGAGLGYKQITLEVRGDWIKAMSIYSGWGLDVNQISFMVGYKF